MARWNLPRPSLVCTGTPSMKHVFINVYDRPWQQLWFKRHLRACQYCDEIRYDPTSAYRERLSR